MILLFNSLKKFKMLQTTDISGNEVDDSFFPVLADFIKNSESESLNISIEAHSDDIYYDFDYYIEQTTNKNITDIGIEYLYPVLIGNTKKIFLSLNYQAGITDKSFPLIKEILESSHTEFDLYWTAISQKNQEIIEQLALVPFEDRKIPLASNTKSASKNQN